MPRAGLTAERVVEAAQGLADTQGMGAVTLAALAAHFGVKPPSLYNHVAGLEDLRKRVALRTIDDLAETLRTAVMGRSGSAALERLADAYRSYVVAHPGTYPLTQVAHPEDPEYREASRRAIEPALAVLAGYGLHGDEAIHATRAIRSALHGFVMLEAQGGFGLEQDLDESFRRLVAMLEASLAG
jgi:AcrR family transcriptional regulator